jgi:hypothetical protein
VPAPSLLELQRERRETTELGYPGRCRRQPRKHRGPVPVHPWQRAWFMARDPGLRGEIGLRHRPGLILTPPVPHTWASPGPGQVFFLSFGSLKPGRWDLGPQPAHAGHRHSQSAPLPFLPGRAPSSVCDEPELPCASPGVPGRARWAGLAHPSSVTDGQT